MTGCMAKVARDYNTPGVGRGEWDIIGATLQTGHLPASVDESDDISSDSLFSCSLRRGYLLCRLGEVSIHTGEKFRS